MLTVLSLTISCITVLGIWLAGNHDPRGWLLGILNQGLWLILIVVTQAWGLLLLLVALLFVYGRNLVKWRAGR